jgi:hypothetical protein
LLRVASLTLTIGLLAVAMAACGDDSGGSATATTVAPTSEIDTDPPPPELPSDFTWTGRYVVPDLDVDVPFTWTGNNGDMQMIAGGEDEPIYFTNVISDGQLYTLTYTWPGIERRPCSPIGPFTRDDLNQGLSGARFVGPETLEGDPSRHVNHFRVGVVIDVPPEVLSLPGVPDLRLPLMSGDLYVDRDDATQWWQVLQFGVQNLYDAEQDEWIRIDTIDDAPGAVELPQECADEAATAPPGP